MNPSDIPVGPVEKFDYGRGISDGLYECVAHMRTSHGPAAVIIHRRPYAADSVIIYTGTPRTPYGYFRPKS